MIADWQMEVIRALTNMLDEVCCSSKLAYTEKNVFVYSKEINSKKKRKY